MALIRWIFALAVLSVWIPFVLTALYAATYERPDPIPEAAAIVVLGGAARDGELFHDTAERVRKGVELYQDGKAPVIVMTGGGSPVVVADAMADAAREAGVPEDAILVENASQSTLQNALFTADLAGIDPEAPILLVTDLYHLPRSWASFRWAGFRDVTPVATDGGVSFVNKLIYVEAVKWPINVLRAAAASAAMAADVPRDDYIKYLN